jgi:hypothetical protein
MTATPNMSFLLTGHEPSNLISFSHPTAPVGALNRSAKKI